MDGLKIEWLATDLFVGFLSKSELLSQYDHFSQPYYFLILDTHGVIA